MNHRLKLNKNTVEPLHKMATWGTGESGCCREMAVVERLKQESKYGLSAKNSGRWR